MNNLSIRSIALFLLFLFYLPVHTAEANVFNRIKDIYEVPDRIEEMQEQYNANIQLLEGQVEEQRQRLEQSRKQAEELLLRQDEMLSRQEEMQKNNEMILQENELYRQQNEALSAENQQLLQRMDQMEDSRKAFIRKTIWSVGTIILLTVAYTASIRIWRYMVWRRQGRDRQGAWLP